MHKLLERQLNRCIDSLDAIPAEWQRFIDAMDEAYKQADDDRALLEHSFELTAQGLLETNRQLRRDIAERMKAEEALADSLSVLRATLESTTDGILVVDDDGKITSFNQQFVELWQIPRAIQESRDRNQMLLFVKDQLSDPDSFLAKIEALYAQPDAESYDILEFKDGRVFERYSRPQRIGSKSLGRVWSFRDVTERVRGEAALKESEERFRSAFNLSSIGMVLTTPEGCYLKVNQAFCDMLGYSEEELLGITFPAITHPDELESNLEYSAQLLEGTIKSFLIEKRYIHKNGHTVWALLNVSLFRDAQGMPMNFIGQVQDITQRKAYERQLKEQAEAQAQLLHQLMSAQEAERRRLSMDIHDGPLQSLGVSLLALDRGIRWLKLQEYETAERELLYLRANLAGTVSEVRAVLADLSLEILSSYGLVFALRSHIERFSDVTEIKVAFKSGVRRHLPADVELLMYRLAQEALANIRKHADASRAAIALRVDGDTLRMTISDNGKGFDPVTVLGQHCAGERLGLRSMRERVQIAGGDLNIRSIPREGTELEFWCPLPARQRPTRLTNTAATRPALVS